MAVRKGEHPEFRQGREALLDAAMRVVAREGFDGLTYRSVAAEAGTTHGLVTYHFGTLNALIHEAAVKASAHAAQSAALLPESDDVEDFVRGISSSVEHGIETHVFQHELVLQARRRPELGREIRALYEEYFLIVQQTLGALGVEDPSAPVARFVFAAIDGMAVQQLVHGDQRRTDEAVAVLRRVLRLLGAHSADEEA